ncbi:MAG TPA: RICIN domain-containing protein, partial [Streptosporangiaceae bacterium]|nr:RICIN domain-containing protein [Streptosporangiaceae bacterium]
CLSVDDDSTSAGTDLVQYPCFGGADQLWYMGGVSLNTTYVITSASSGLVADVQSAYPWPGGTMDQWYYNGGWNQQFWLTNSGN